MFLCHWCIGELHPGAEGSSVRFPIDPLPFNARAGRNGGGEDAKCYNIASGLQI